MGEKDHPPTEITLAPGMQLSGGLVVQSLLRTGGLSRLWAVERGGERCILKTFRYDPQWSTEQARESYYYFLNEGHWLPLLAHPKVVRGPGIVVVCDRPAVLRQFIEGTDLRDWIDSSPSRRHGCDLRSFARIGLGLIVALKYLHCQGLVHRDLAPWNIIIGPALDATIIDLQFVRLVSLVEGNNPYRSALQMTYGIGRWAYGAPELMDGLDEGYDQRADIYSLGAILIELLVGRPPRRRPPAAWRHDLPHDVSGTCWAAVDELPTNRPHLDEIAHVLQGIELCDS